MIRTLTGTCIPSLQYILVDVDPRVVGIDAPSGSLAVYWPGTGNPLFLVHTGPAPTDWTTPPAGGGPLTNVLTAGIIGAGPVDDYAPAGLYNPSLVQWLRQQVSADSVLTGLSATSAVNGDQMVLSNVGSFHSITLNHEDAGSAADNRFLIGGGAPLVIPAFGVVTLIRDAVAHRWVVNP
jgi:hypothetical protein